jgi:hypothetical protein
MTAIVDDIGVLRPIKALPMPDIKPAMEMAERPTFEWVNPADLLVEERYQRNLAEKSLRLIRRIVSEWDWSRMKPPICARDAAGRLFVVDGQHTAIAAASHPGVTEIPVIVINVATVQGRAAAFIGHNRDRIAMTPMQIYFASLAAADPVAVAMADACSRASVSIRKSPPANGIYREGETVAVKAIEAIVSRKGAPGGARVLKVLRDAGRAPITAQEIKAVSALLFEAEWKDMVDAVGLATVIRSKSSENWAGIAESQVRRGKTMSLWRAIAIAWFRALPKKRKAGE